MAEWLQHVGQYLPAVVDHSDVTSVLCTLAPPPPYPTHSCPPRKSPHLGTEKGGGGGGGIVTTTTREQASNLQKKNTKKNH